MISSVMILNTFWHPMGNFESNIHIATVCYSSICDSEKWQKIWNYGKTLWNLMKSKTLNISNIFHSNVNIVNINFLQVIEYNFNEFESISVLWEIADFKWKLSLTVMTINICNGDFIFKKRFKRSFSHIRL